MEKALLIYPKFFTNTFWNYKVVCKIVGKKHPASPLGLATIAAMFPKSWKLKIVDLNIQSLLKNDIIDADLVFIGGMISQQQELINLIDYIHTFDKKVVVGGPDPTSQPAIYQNADYLVLGEVEHTLLPFLEDYKNGIAKKIYNPPSEKPEMTKSPIPRFDLLNLNAYMMIGIQITRGCPFNCEFCDIIELYGRIPRMKSSEQIILELTTLYNLGFRGHIDFVDDNFIGNSKKIKIILKDLISWSKSHQYPFYFSTEASINLADDDELLKLMQELDFRYIFIGIETMDDAVLKATQKYQNTRRKIEEDLNKIYSYGIIVCAGLIVGFDHETSSKARSIIDLVKLGKIPFAMAGLLHALPNTQLTRRLKKTNRYFEDSNHSQQNMIDSFDQTTSGLNFITDRPKVEVLQDYIHIIKTIYNKREYFDRCLNLALSLKGKRKFKSSFGDNMMILLAFLKVIFHLGLNPKTAYYFWRNFFKTIPHGISKVESLIAVETMYLHYGKQSKYVIKVLNQRLKLLDDNPEPIFIHETKIEPIPLQVNK